MNGICQTCSESSRRSLVVVTRDGACGVCGSKAVETLSTTAAGAAAIITAQKERSLKAAAMDLVCAESRDVHQTAEHLGLVVNDYLHHLAETAELLEVAP
jgi:hypothetical protein